MEVKLVLEFFMIVLCILAGPFGEEDMDKELVVDLIGERGYMDTLIVRHADAGFAVYDEMNGKLVEVIRIQPVKDKKLAYVCTDMKGKKETVNIPQSIVDFKSMEIGKTKRDILKLKDGSTVRLDRSGDVVYLTPMVQKRTYAVRKRGKPTQ